MPEALHAKHKRTEATYQLDIPNSDQKVSIGVELIPAEDLPVTFINSPNVARVKIGQKDFFVVAGKTVAI